jgi:ribonuclease HI
VYTDGSATNATTKGGAGIYIQYPNGEQQSEAIPTGLHGSNYKAEGEAIIHAVHTIKCKLENTQVVFLTDALSVLQALMNDNLYLSLNRHYTPSKPLEQCLLQWIPSHCGVHGN